MHSPHLSDQTSVYWGGVSLGNACVCHTQSMQMNLHTYVTSQMLKVYP